MMLLYVDWASYLIIAGPVGAGIVWWVKNKYARGYEGKDWTDSNWHDEINNL